MTRMATLACGSSLGDLAAQHECSTGRTAQVSVSVSRCRGHARRVRVGWLVTLFRWRFAGASSGTGGLDLALGLCGDTGERTGEQDDRSWDVLRQPDLLAIPCHSVHCVASSNLVRKATCVLVFWESTRAFAYCGQKRLQGYMIDVSESLLFRLPCRFADFLSSGAAIQLHPCAV